MATTAVKRKLAAIKESPSKRHKSDKTTQNIANSSPQPLELTPENSACQIEFLNAVADLLIQHKLSEVGQFVFKEKKGQVMEIEHPTTGLIFELRECSGRKQMEIQRILREANEPNILVADVSFEFNHRRYHVRRKNPQEISLVDYMANPTAIALSLTDLVRGVHELYMQFDYLQPMEVDQTRPLRLEATYEPEDTMILPNKEGGFDFKYRVPDESSLATLPNDGCGWLCYPSSTMTTWSHPVYTTLAKVAAYLGASHEVCQRIRALVSPLRDMYFENFIKCCNIDHKPRRARDRASRCPDTVLVDDALLAHLSDLFVSHHVLESRPVLRQVIEKKSPFLVLCDQNGNYFEVLWNKKKSEGRAEMMMHKILRESHVPHLLTAEFGFEYNESYGTVRRYDPNGLTIDKFYGKLDVELKLPHVVKAVQQMCTLFGQVIAPKYDLSPEYPLSLTAKFGSHNLRVIPDGNGGYDFKYVVDQYCTLTKLADDHIGVFEYRARNDDDEPSFGLFWMLSVLAERADAPPELVDRIDKLHSIMTIDSFNDLVFA